MRGTASVLLRPEVVDHLLFERDREVEILKVSDFGDGLQQVTLAHDHLPPGYNGQAEMFFAPWPRGEIRFRREADT